MNKFIEHEGIVAPFDMTNIDTDMIIPKQFLKSIKRQGFGVNLFDSLRYLDEGQPDQDNALRKINKDFVLNKAAYTKSSILLARENFGCGSSREHAPWAIEDFGFRCLVAPSYADIFYNNCFKNGLLPIVLTSEEVDQLFKLCEAQPGVSLKVSLPEQSVSLPDGRQFKFSIDGFRKTCLLEGLDEIGLTLQHKDKITAFETRHKHESPWLFNPLV